MSVANYLVNWFVNVIDNVRSLFVLILFYRCPLSWELLLYSNVSGPGIPITRSNICSYSFVLVNQSEYGIWYGIDYSIWWVCYLISENCCLPTYLSCVWCNFNVLICESISVDFWCSMDRNIIFYMNIFDHAQNIPAKYFPRRTNCLNWLISVLNPEISITIYIQDNDQPQNNIYVSNDSPLLLTSTCLFMFCLL